MAYNFNVALKLREKLEDAYVAGLSKLFQSYKMEAVVKKYL